ncbi:hypothetical protein KL929_003390 [Ogataea haglerorum]|nr:hypothetical protein KL929_003390 [Ogataea haglerorum]
MDAQDVFQDMPLISPTISPSRAISMNGNGIEGHKLERDQLPETLPLVECVARARIPTTQGPEIFLHLYSNNVDNKEHLAIVFGEDIRSKSLFKRRPGETQHDRMTRGAYVGKLRPGRDVADRDDVLGIELKFDEDGNMVNETKLQEPVLFDEAGRLMGEKGHGCIVYLRQEGRGIGLGEKLKAYNLQDLGADTVQANLMLRHPADKRSFSLATAILLDLGLVEIQLLTNNPDKIVAVEGKNRSVKVVKRIPMIPLAWQRENAGIKSKEVEGYLRTKVEKMGHLLTTPDV